MALNQMNEQLNDAFEMYFPELGLMKKIVNRITTFSLRKLLKLRTNFLGGTVLVNERIIEYLQIIRWLKPEGIVLDIGCVSSRLPIQLSSLGYNVHGVDTRPYPFKHPNFQFYKADIFEFNPQQTFDIIILVSTLEHFGLGLYGDLILPEADKKAVERISNWLSEDGQLLISLPFGKAEVIKRHRIYDLERLNYLFSSFQWVDQRYFKRVEGSWLPCSPEELREVTSSELPPNGVALLNLKYTRR